MQMRACAKATALLLSLLLLCSPQSGKKRESARKLSARIRSEQIEMESFACLRAFLGGSTYPIRARARSLAAIQCQAKSVAYRSGQRNLCAQQPAAREGTCVRTASWLPKSEREGHQSTCNSCTFYCRRSIQLARTTFTATTWKAGSYLSISLQTSVSLVLSLALLRSRTACTCLAPDRIATPPLTCLPLNSYLSNNFVSSENGLEWPTTNRTMFQFYWARSLPATRPYYCSPIAPSCWYSEWVSQSGSYLF